MTQIESNPLKCVICFEKQQNRKHIGYTCRVCKSKICIDCFDVWGEEETSEEGYKRTEDLQAFICPIKCDYIDDVNDMVDLLNYYNERSETPR
jgi:hypothetical protein